MNSATLATVTHRELGKVVDDQQVKGEDDSKEAVYGRRFFMKGGSKEEREKKQYSNLNHSDI